MTQVALLEGRKLQKTYRRKGVFTKGAEIRAVEEISLSVASKETVAVVGESGCGKSTTAKMLLGLEELSAGGVYFEGRTLPVRMRICVDGIDQVCRPFFRTHGAR